MTYPNIIERNEMKRKECLIIPYTKPILRRSNLIRTEKVVKQFLWHNMKVINKESINI